MPEGEEARRRGGEEARRRARGGLKGRAAEVKRREEEGERG